MSGHDIRRGDRTMAWVSRVILAMRDDDITAAWMVLDETHDDPETLRTMVVALASLVGGRMPEGYAEGLVADRLDKLAAPPRGRWYPGDPEDDPNNPPPPLRPDDAGGLG